MSYAPPQKYEPMSVDDNGAGESFIATGTAVDAPTPEAEPYLEVVAPATLPEVSLGSILLFQSIENTMCISHLCCIRAGCAKLRDTPSMRRLMGKRLQ